MFHKDLIPYVCNYLTEYNYYFMNKSIYKMMQSEEKNDYWKQKYDNFFKTMNKEYLILKGDYNWKREYLRIIKFQHWLNINNLSYLNLSFKQINKIPKEIDNLTNLKYLVLSNNKIKEIPKEVGNLTNLQDLYLSKNEIKEIPKELCNLTNLKCLYLYNNQIKEIPKEIETTVNLINLPE